MKLAEDYGGLNVQAARPVEVNSESQVDVESMDPLDSVNVLVSHEAKDASSWDAFISRTPGAHFEQTSAWAKVKHIYGWKPCWVIVSRRAQILGGAMVLTRRVGRFFTLGYVLRGPVWTENEPDTMLLATKALCQFARSMNMAYMVVVPPYSADGLIPVLRSLRFHHKPDLFPPSGIDTATLVIDLREDLQAIFARMSMTKRQNIRRGIRKGVKVRIGGQADVETFRTLMVQACKRRGISPSPWQKDFFEHLWQNFGPSGMVKFFVAEVNGEPVSGACTIVFGPRLLLWRVGWSGKFEKYDPNDVLHWEIIRWAKENGCREFDFAHIRRSHASAILRGEKIADSYSGITDYKLSFGGELRLTPEHYFRSFQPAIHSVLSMGAARVVNSAVGTKVFHGIARKVLGQLPS